MVAFCQGFSRSSHVGISSGRSFAAPRCHATSFTNAGPWLGFEAKTCAVAFLKFDRRTTVIGATRESPVLPKRAVARANEATAACSLPGKRQMATASKHWLRLHRPSETRLPIKPSEPRWLSKQTLHQNWHRRCLRSASSSPAYYFPHPRRTWCQSRLRLSRSKCDRSSESWD